MKVAHRHAWATLICALAFLGFATKSASQQASILEVSSFLMPPRSSWALIDRSADPNVVISEPHKADGAGFRVIHLRKSTHATKQAAIDLARSKLVKTGDVLLSFRPLWDRTLAYAHMQMGVSHSALAFIVADSQGPFVMTLESPISYSSPLNSPDHYPDVDAIHVIRPDLSPSQVRNLEHWARLTASKRDRFEFYPDYSMPMYRRGLVGVSSPRDEARLLAEILLGRDARKFSSFCSEFVWSMLALRDCDPATFGQACIHPPFSTASGMMTGMVPKFVGDAGLAQGPEASLARGGVPLAKRRAILTEEVFVDVLTDETKLKERISPGHIKVAEANREIMRAINSYYQLGETASAASAVNLGLADNVSPASYLVRSNAGLDGFTYVGTVIFDR